MYCEILPDLMTPPWTRRHQSQLSKVKQKNYEKPYANSRPRGIARAGRIPWRRQLKFHCNLNSLECKLDISFSFTRRFSQSVSWRGERVTKSSEPLLARYYSSFAKLDCYSTRSLYNKIIFVVYAGCLLNGLVEYDTHPVFHGNLSACQPR